MTWRRNRGWWLGTWAAIAAGVIGGAVVVSGTDSPPAPPAPAGTANIWVDTNGGTCTRQAAPAAYVDSAACSSFNAAYQAASLGDTVYVRSGSSYGAQSLVDQPSKDGSTSLKVHIEAEPGATVVVTDLLVRASNVRFANFTVDLDAGVGQPDIREPAHDVTVENVNATNLYVTGAAYNILFKGGSYGPYVATSGSQIKTTGNGGDDPVRANQPHAVTLDGVYMHDYSVPPGSSGVHLDCLHVFYHYGLTVKNSRFVNCGMPNNGYGILLGSNGAGNAEGDVFENNVFDGAIAGFALRGGAGEDFDDVLVRNNSGGLITTQTTNTLTNVRWIGNAASDVTPCRANTYRYNVATTNGCSGTGNVTANPLFTNPGAGTYTLQSGSPAREAGDPTNYPATDILGAARPVGSLPDAGAYEYTP